MNSDLLESIDNALPNLEAIRERIIAMEATKANRTALDRAYVAVADALEALEGLRNNTCRPTKLVKHSTADAIGSSDAGSYGTRAKRGKRKSSRTLTPGDFVQPNLVRAEILHLLEAITTAAENGQLSGPVEVGIVASKFRDLSNDHDCLSFEGDSGPQMFKQGYNGDTKNPEFENAFDELLNAETIG